MGGKIYDFFENVFRPKKMLYEVIFDHNPADKKKLTMPDRLGWVPVDFEISYFFGPKNRYFSP